MPPRYLFSIEITLKQIFVSILSLDIFGFSIRAPLLELFSQKKKKVKLGWSQKSNIHGQIDWEFLEIDIKKLLRAKLRLLL